MTTAGPPRPHVILTTTASADGRITLSRAQRLLEPGVWDRWEAAWAPDVRDLVERRRRWIDDHHAPTVTLDGSGTFVADDATSPWSGTPDTPDTPDASVPTPDPADHLPGSSPRWYAVVDGRGRVDWTFTGDDENALLVLVCRTTPSGYLERLRELGVGYLVAGEERVDLAQALARLHTALGATAVVLDGGGGLNSAMLRAGLVDEVHVVTFPALIGGLDTPSFVDGEPLPPDGTPTALRLDELVQGAAGSTWARYEVLRT